MGWLGWFSFTKEVQICNTELMQTELRRNCYFATSTEKLCN